MGVVRVRLLLQQMLEHVEKCEIVNKKEDVLQFAYDTCIICHSKSVENLLFEINSVFEHTYSYMRQNMLALNRDKSEIVIFSKKNGESKIEQLHYNGNFKEPKISCRYLGMMIDNHLNFDIQLNKILAKMANAIRSIYLVSHLILLKARMGLFKSLVLSHLHFSAIFFQSLSVMSLQIVNRQINWEIKVSHVRKKFDSARDLFLKDKILPAELFIKKVCLEFFDLLSQYKESSRETKNSSFRFFEKLELTKNSRTAQFFPKNKCQSKWSDMSLIRNFSRKWNNLPIEIRKEKKTKNKFKEKLSSEMVKLHERVPIDRQVRGFSNFFY